MFVFPRSTIVISLATMAEAGSVRPSEWKTPTPDEELPKGFAARTIVAIGIVRLAHRFDSTKRGYEVAQAFVYRTDKLGEREVIARLFGYLGISAGLVVTAGGRTFDIPLLEQRAAWLDLRSADYDALRLGERTTERLLDLSEWLVSEDVGIAAARSGAIELVCPNIASVGHLVKCGCSDLISAQVLARVFMIADLYLEYELASGRLTQKERAQSGRNFETMRRIHLS